ncbi:tail assembly chaperone [Escherichia coli]|uniref:tail fiber assembly protein n=1 Tax=Escherichia coli TaxID=562 RepID=UPI001919DB4A|nr:tail fiber assembly protein [Escherichia coli]UMT24968.1 tail assembly chaperone [Escherichia coli]CAD6169593.1 tail fiber assembly protein [Escherichia coli]
MLNLKNFTEYTPDSDRSELVGLGVGFLQNEAGNDWYEAQGNYSPDTYKVMYDTKGVVRSIVRDVSGLYPNGFSVAEVESLPDGVDIDGNWVFDGENVVARTLTAAEWLAKAESQRSALISDAKETISLWQSELLLGTISDDDKESLTEWIAYIKALQALDLSGVTDEESYNATVWPDEPGVTA